MKYEMSHKGSVEGEGYDMNGKDSGCGKGMEYSMAGGGIESTKGEKAVGSNTKGKFEVEKD